MENGKSHQERRGRTVVEKLGADALDNEDVEDVAFDEPVKPAAEHCTTDPALDGTDRRNSAARRLAASRVPTFAVGQAFNLRRI